MPNERAQLQYPADEESKRAIETAADSFLSDKSKLFWDRYFHHTDFFTGNPVGFNSGYSFLVQGTNATITNSGQSLNLGSGTTANTLTILRKNPDWFPYLNYNAPSFFRASVAVSANTNTSFHVVVGKLSDRYYGFRFTGQTLSGVVSNRNTETVANLGNAVFTNVTANARIDISAAFYPNTKCLFFVNGLEAGGVFANLPTATTTENLNAFYEFSVYTADTTQRTLSISYFDFLGQKIIPSRA